MNKTYLLILLATLFIFGIGGVESLERTYNGNYYFDYDNNINISTWLDFDGSTSDIGGKGVKIADQDYFSPYNNNNKTTISVWFKTDGIYTGDGTDYRRYLISKSRNDTSYDFEWDIVVVNKTSSNYLSESAYFKELTRNGTFSSTTNCIDTYTLGKWHNCQIVLDGTYHIGYGDRKWSDSGTINRLNGNGTGYLQIGERGGLFFNGSIDDIKIYKEPLSNVAFRNLSQQSKHSSYKDKFIPVLMLHQYVGDAPADSSLKLNETLFTQLLDFLNESNYTTITDVEYYNWTQDNGFVMPDKPIIISWDDGNVKQWLDAAIIQETYEYKSIMNIYTSGIVDVGTNNWTTVNELINDYGWSVTSHSDSHCSLVGTNYGTCDVGTGLCTCNTTETMIGNLSQSKEIIIDKTGITPITFVHPYNDWNQTTMNNCNIYYSLCFGSASSRTYTWKSNFIDKISNFTNGDLQRIEISNETTLTDLNRVLNYSYNIDSLVGDWMFNENTGTIAYDNSSYGNNGTISGATWNNDFTGDGWALFKNIGTVNSKMFFYNLTNALIYNTNGTIYGSTTISDNDGNVNITLAPNNASYVLDNFNLTEGTLRANSPLNISGNKESKTITSTLTDTITVDVIMEVDSCESIGNIIQDGTTTYQRGSYTCSDNYVTISLPLDSSSTLEIEYGCSSLTRTGYMLVMIFASLLIVGFVIVIAWRNYKEGNLDMKTLIMMFIIILICLGMWIASGQNLGSSCGVVG